MLRDGADDVGNHAVAGSLNFVAVAGAADRDGAANGAKAGVGIRSVGRDDHRSFGAVSLDERGGGIDVDDAAVLDDGDTVTQALGFFHEVRGQHHRLASGPNGADKIPDGVSRLRIESGGELIEEHDIGIVDERQRDEKALLLSARQGHEPGVTLLPQTKLLEQVVAIDRCRVERLPEVDRLPHFDTFLELRLLKLHPDPVLQGETVASGVKAEDRNLTAVRRAQSGDAFHRRRLARAIRSDEAEDLTTSDGKRHAVDGDERAVALSNAVNADDVDVDVHHLGLHRVDADRSKRLGPVP